MKLSMRNKFLLPTLGVLVLALLVAAVFSYLNAYDSLYASMERELNNTAILARDQLRLWISDRKADVANWSRAAVIENAVAGDKQGAAQRVKTADAWLAGLAKSYTHYEFLGVMGSDGKLAAGSNPAEAADLKLSEREFVKTALSGKHCLSEVWISKKSGHPVFAIASPVETEGRTIGVFFAVTDLAKFSAAFIDKLKFGKTGYAYLFQEDGLLLAHPGKQHILTLDMKTFDFGRKMMRDKDGTIVYTWKGVEKIVVYRTDTITNWTIGLGAGTAELMAPARRLGWLILVVAVVSLVVACLVIFMATSSIIKPLRNTAAGLKNGAFEVSQAAGMMAGASQELAQGASEQASALEQSSSSLEQMASMTHQSAANAQQADSLMRQAGEVIGRSDEAMRELTTSMADISRASEETAGIIRTIDEIAFQTNLLALNAAVEAARAGEAGAGFAVVADEVRNLAMRAAEAARSTAELIEGTLEKVKSGTALVDKTAEAFGGVSKASTKVGELVSEISAASTEQDQGIDQVNRAVGEMDKLTQKNASGSEEIASASEELSAQSAAIEGHVQRLLLIMNGQPKNPKKPRDKKRRSFKATKLLPRP